MLYSVEDLVLGFLASRGIGGGVTLESLGCGVTLEGIGVSM